MDRFDRVLKSVGAAFVVILLATVTAGIVARALNHPLSWTEEASGFLMVWLACLGWMIATRHQSHIRIRFFLDLLPAKAGRGAEAILQVGVAVFGAVIAWYSIYLLRVNSDIEATTLPLSVAWMYVPLLPAGLLTMAQALTEIWARAAGTTAKGHRALP